jgi:asparagine synthase (glutamine-hydrolysing)
MCGIGGIFYFEGNDHKKFNDHQRVLEKLKHRGPDFQNYFGSPNCILYHARLSILDVSNASNQPFSKNNQHLCFNGELFNYLNIKNELTNIASSGDVEVMHGLLGQKEKSSALNKTNGFFALAFYDQNTNELIIARDRLGIKPLYYFADKNKIAFASELKPLLELVGEQELDEEQLYTYFRLNYCAGNKSIFKNIQQLEPGYFLKATTKGIEKVKWYEVPKTAGTNDLYTLLNDSTKLRLHADVPVGCFLSGGVDSSIISALAAKQHKQVHTFSIGFKDEPFFDETKYAQLVAKHIGSAHHEFKLSNTDFLENIHPFLNNIDEPFADSSALNVYILSKLTKKHVKVALSGDGADELFKGYNKHKALMLSRKFTTKFFAKIVAPVAGSIGESRQGSIQNKVRQLKKFEHLISLNAIEKQSFLAQISSNEEVNNLFSNKVNASYFNSLFKVNELYKSFELEDVFDLQTVLKDDMLVKADRFSMQHGLEIRNPFLDYRIVEYALNLKADQKINTQEQKIILRKTFANLLPEEIFNRSKKGFELPLWKWLNNEMKNEIETKWLSKELISDQKLFNYAQVEKLKKQLFSNKPGDSAAKVWALIVFQNWYLQNNHFIKHA